MTPPLLVILNYLSTSNDLPRVAKYWPWLPCWWDSWPCRISAPWRRTRGWCAPPRPCRVIILVLVVGVTSIKRPRSLIIKKNKAKEEQFTARSCDITVDSTTPAPLKRCLYRKVDLKQMQHIMFMFHYWSRYKAGLLQKGCIILYFQIETNSLKLDAVTKKCVLNCLHFEQIVYENIVI